MLVLSQRVMEASRLPQEISQRVMEASRLPQEISQRVMEASRLPQEISQRVMEASRLSREISVTGRLFVLHGLPSGALAARLSARCVQSFESRPHIP
jgi:hypothetical protein